MMPWSNWNHADKTLLFAFVLFLFGLILKIEYPASLFAQGFLFVAEAALVGGVADWFAVTALFRKPLGFPYHTEILPRRRREFIEAAIKLVQREFFTSRRLIMLVDSYDWKSVLLRFAKGEEIRIRAENFVYGKVVGFLESVDFSEYTGELSDSLRNEVKKIPVSILFTKLRDYLAAGGRDRRFLAQGALWLKEKAESEEACQLIHDEIESMVQKKVENAGILGMLFASLAKASNLVNVDELTDVIRDEALRFLDEAADAESETSDRIIAIFYRKLAEAEEDEGLVNALEAARDRFLSSMPLQETVENLLADIRHRTKEALQDSASEPSRLLRGAIEREIDMAWELLENDERVRVLLDSLVRDMAGRSALKAQEIGGVVVREVMERLTDEQLNSIVYDKVEPDLLWIRMNGSVVGALIGCVLFVFMTAVK